MFFNMKDNDSKQRFGIRKLTIGACSVLLSTLILGVGTQEQNSKAQAATTETSNTASSTDLVDNHQNKNTYLSSSEVNETATKVNEKETSTDNELQDSQAAVAQDKQSGEKAADVAADKQTTVEDKSSNNAESSETTTDTKNTKDSSDTSNLDLKNIQESLERQAKENAGKALDDKSVTSLLRSSAAANFQVLAASTENIAEADEIKANAAVTIPSTDGRYTLYISRNTWGNTTDGDKSVKVLLSGSVLAGDTVTISIPSYGILGVKQPTIDANYGSASIKGIGNDKAVTYNFTTSGVINPIIMIPADNGYFNKTTPMQIAQPTVKDITWTVNGVEQTSAEFHIDVNPVWNPKFSLSKPNPNSTDKNALKKMIPNYESIYQLAINETNGVAPGQDYSNAPFTSQKINSAVNYGTVITIPMPKGYVLDQSATMQLNNFGDKSTITQEGNNVIITVPKGSGTQNWNSGPAYQLVGLYDIAMPAIATTYTAAAPITIVQKLNDDGSQTKIWNGPTVSQDFYGINDEIPLGKMSLYGKAAYIGNQLLNNGHKQIVAYYCNY